MKEVLKQNPRTRQKLSEDCVDPTSGLNIKINEESREQYFSFMKPVVSKRATAILELRVEGWKLGDWHVPHNQLFVPQLFK